MDVTTLRTLLKQHQPELRERYAVASLLLFGSVARGQASAASDIDLLVEFERPVGYFGLVALQEYLSSILAMPVDLGTLRSLKPRIRSRVEKDLQRVL